MNSERTQVRHTLKYRQILIFCVASILPMLLFCYVLVKKGLLQDPESTILLGASVSIALLGFICVLRIVNQFAILAREIDKAEQGDVGELSMPGTAVEFSEMLQISNAFKTTLSELKTHTKELENLVEKINTMSEMTELVSRIPNINDIIHIVLTRTMGSVNAKIGSIMLVDEKTQSLRIAASEGLDDAVVANTNIRLGEKIAGKVAQMGESMLVDNIEADPRFQKTSNPKYESTSFISMPLRAQHRVMGVLNLSKRSDNADFSSSDLKFLKSLLGHIGFALENARLLKDAQVAARRLQSVVQEQSSQLGVLEQKALESMKLFHEAQKLEATSNMAGGLAHDFNNLLMGIQGNLSMMLLDTEPTHPSYDRLRNMERYVDSGAEITQQLMSFARGGGYDPKPIDLNRVVKDTSKIFGRTHRGVTIEEKNQQDIWIVEADRGQVEQVLLNIYLNALQAMDQGGELHIRTENVNLHEDFVRPYDVEPGKYVKISISDTGVGMDEAVLERIFEPFFTTKGSERGTGLGLASAYGIITNHGGIIAAESRLGEGTTFNVFLPATDRKLIQADSEVAGRITKGEETILLIDDEEMILSVGSAMMETLGYKVITAQSGQAAIDIYEKNRSDIALVVLDMIMPIMGGGEIFDRLKEIDPDIKVLLASGYMLNGQAELMLERGCNGFIQKPFKAAKLSQTIMKILGGR